MSRLEQFGDCRNCWQAELGGGHAGWGCCLCVRVKAGLMSWVNAVWRESLLSRGAPVRCAVLPGGMHGGLHGTFLSPVMWYLG